MTEATTIGHFFVLVVLVTLYSHFSVFAFLQLQFFYIIQKYVVVNKDRDKLDMLSW